MTVSDDDWRLQGQERYLRGVTLHRRAYRRPRPGWDHDRCEFCGAKFAGSGDPAGLREGYTTADEYHWVCPQCFGDFSERFGWPAEAPS